jgi:hypothetical protein
MGSRPDPSLGILSNSVQAQRDDKKQQGASAPPHVLKRSSNNSKTQPTQHHQHISQNQEERFFEFCLGYEADYNQRQRRGYHPVNVSCPKHQTPTCSDEHTVAARHGKVREAADCCAEKGNDKHQTTALFFRAELLIKKEQRGHRHACRGNKQEVLVGVVEVLNTKSAMKNRKMRNKASVRIW